MSSIRFVRASCGSSVVRSRFIHQQSVVGAGGGLLGKLFGGSKKPEDKVDPQAPMVSGDTIGEETKVQYEQLAKDLEKGPLQLKFPKRQYPPARLEYRIKKLLDASEVPVDSADWKLTRLDDKADKLKVLSSVMKYVKLPVSSRMLNNIRTVGDLIKELDHKPASKDDGHPVAQYFKENVQELPANMKFEPFAKGTRKLHAHQ
ncbi:hypothetical protein GGI01_003315 [Coemansia sp. RSA 376]|nr:hypothetical protein GGI14_000687 [Coemansia sp. S680]KAJ2037438.1 hypothetical protein H4S04_008576 [Coemansia sp. S16]KAJ2045816.1 hypothetical protein GGI08_006703 [Coemansia sp. S2]KAJ2110044.1 hypothetical protein IW146_006083 [Coemansia sp. RSA 922]KAJ2241523.1 hypothetical protein GGI13_007300 [Coemansia sp. RSA 455]KAJ2259951.1 hypothetical protein GGI01_003315 [Coemansia sp. RSA 376]